MNFSFTSITSDKHFYVSSQEMKWKGCVQWIGRWQK